MSTKKKEKAPKEIFPLYSEGVTAIPKQKRQAERFLTLEFDVLFPYINRISKFNKNGKNWVVKKCIFNNPVYFY